MNPILVSIGDFYIAWYGLFVALGLLGATVLAIYLARRSDLDPNVVLDSLVVVTVGLIIGARLFFIITNWGDFLETPWAILFSRDGFVFLGGLIGAVVAEMIYLRVRGIPIWRALDIGAPAVPLGHAFGRVGCHFTGCCFGAPVPAGWESWGIHVPPGLHELADGTYKAVGGYAWFDHVEHGLIGPGAEHSLAVWPVQLYSATANLLLAGLLIWLFFRRRWPGQVFLSYLILYSVVRFGLEYLRGDEDRGVYEVAGALRFSFSQIIGFAVFAAGVVGYWFGRNGKLPNQHAPFPENLTISGQEAVRAGGDSGGEGGSGDGLSRQARRKKARAAN